MRFRQKGSTLNPDCIAKRRVNWVSSTRGGFSMTYVLLTQQQIEMSRKRIDANYRGSKTVYMWLYLP